MNISAEQNLSQRTPLILSLVCSMFLFAGCVHRPEAAGDPAVAEQIPHDVFASEVASMAPGAVAVMPSAYGAASEVAAGDFYTSGLGRLCRRADIREANMRYRAAVCRDDSGQWYTVDSVFEAMPR